MSSNKDRKLFKAFAEDGGSPVGAPVVNVRVAASSSDIRRLFKAFFDDQSFHAAVQACSSPAEKHELIRKAGYVPVTHDGVRAELIKCLQPGVPASLEDTEFVGNVIHLASADGSIAVDS